MQQPTTAPGNMMATPGYNLARNAVYLVVGQVASTALSVILTAVLGRWLGVAEFGNYYIILTAATFALVLVDWGHSAYLTREASRRPLESGTLLGGALVFRIAVGFLAAAATALLIGLMGYDMRLEWLAALSVLCALPLALAQAYTFIFRARDRMEVDAAVTIVSKALIVATTVPGVIAGGGLTLVVLAQVVGGLGALAIVVMFARRAELVVAWPGRATLRELAHGGAPIAVFFLVLALQPFIDAMVLAKLVPGEVVGWYGAARNIMGVLVAPATILGNATFPEISRRAHSLPDLRAAIRDNVRLALGIGCLASVGTYLFAGVAINLIYGPGRYDPAIMVLQFFAPGLMLLFVDISLGTAITAIGRTVGIATAKAASIAVTTGLSLILIPFFQARYGNGGLGLVAAFVSTEILMLLAFLRLLPKGAFDYSVLYDCVRALAAALLTVYLTELIPGSMTPWFAIPACIAIYTVLALLTGLARWSDFEAVANLLRNKPGQADQSG